MLSTVETILPVFLLILFGWFLKRIPLLEASAWRSIERLTYYVLFPCLLIVTLAEAPFGNLAVGAVATSIAAAILVVSTSLLVTRKLWPLDGPGFTSVFQGSIRMNTYIGLSIASTLFGAAGMAAAALAIAIIVPIVNVACVLVLARFGSQATDSTRVVSECLKNPLIVGAIVGFLLNFTGLGLPILIGPMAQIMARAALPLGLLAVGAALNLATLHSAGAVVLMTSAVKLVGLPAITFLFLRLFDVTGMEAAIALLFNSLPTATSAYVLASQFGGDARLMAGLTTAETLFSMLSLPLVLSLIS